MTWRTVTADEWADYLNGFKCHGTERDDGATMAHVETATGLELGRVQYGRDDDGKTTRAYSVRVPSLTVQHVDTCLPCYVTDHCNGDSEMLIGVAVDGWSTNATVKAELESECRNYGDMPEFFTDSDVRAAIAECFADADKLFDSSLDIIRDDDGESVAAWFRFSWEFSKWPPKRSKPHSKSAMTFATDSTLVSVSASHLSNGQTIEGVPDNFGEDGVLTMDCIGGQPSFVISVAHIVAVTILEV